MVKKKEKATESKKPNDSASKGGQTTDKPVSRGTGHTNTNLPGTKVNKVEDHKNKMIAGGIIAVAIGALALVSLSTPSSTAQKAPAAASVAEQQPAHAAAASILPQALAPQKTQLAEPA